MVRIAWLSPAHTHSAIGRYTSAVIPFLERHALVDVWAPPSADVQSCGSRPVQFLSDTPACTRKLSEYDHVVYNMGSSYDFHADIFSHYMTLPGAVILHDLSMSSFFESYATQRLRRPEWYLALMGYVYGPEAEHIAFSTVLNGRTSAQEAALAEQFPLFEPTLWNATGAFVHSTFAANRVQARYGDLLPVGTADLPYSDYTRDYGDSELLSREELDLPRDRVVVLASGSIDIHKRVAQLLEAWADEPDLHARSMVVIAGRFNPHYREHLESIVSSRGLDESVRFVDQPDDRMLHSYLHACDLCAVMRLPSTETASASLTESVHFGKPILVTNLGPYLELPDDVFVKVDPTREAASLRAHLRTLVLDDAFRDDRARKMRGYRLDHHDPQAYADRFMRFLGAVESRTVSFEGIAADAKQLLAEESDASLMDRAGQRSIGLAVQVESPEST